VLVVMSDYMGCDFVDYLSVARFDGRWQITNNTYAHNGGEPPAEWKLQQLAEPPHRRTSGSGLVRGAPHAAPGRPDERTGGSQTGSELGGHFNSNLQALRRRDDDATPHMRIGGGDMTNDKDVSQTATPRSGPEVVAPTNRVNVAFPFSKIVIEDSKEFAELAAVVAELAVLIEEVVPGEAIKELRKRAQVLAVRSS